MRSIGPGHRQLDEVRHSVEGELKIICLDARMDRGYSETVKLAPGSQPAGSRRRPLPRSVTASAASSSAFSPGDRAAHAARPARTRSRTRVRTRTRTRTRGRGRGRVRGRGRGRNRHPIRGRVRFGAGCTPDGSPSRGGRGAELVAAIEAATSRTSKAQRGGPYSLISTRRFARRPLGRSLSLTGSSAPRPMISTRGAATPAPTSACFTDSARAFERSIASCS